MDAVHLSAVQRQKVQMANFNDILYGDDNTLQFFLKNSRKILQFKIIRNKLKKIPYNYKVFYFW